MVRNLYLTPFTFSFQGKFQTVTENRNVRDILDLISKIQFTTYLSSYFAVENGKK